VDKLLEEAVMYEQIARDCGVGDPAFQFMMKQSRACFDEALKMEQQQT